MVYSLENIEIYKSCSMHFALVLAVLDINLLNLWPSKSRSRSRSTTFVITPFNGKCKNLQKSSKVFKEVFKLLWKLQSSKNFSKSFSKNFLKKICFFFGKKVFKKVFKIQKTSFSNFKVQTFQRSFQRSFQSFQKSSTRFCASFRRFRDINIYKFSS